MPSSHERAKTLKTIRGKDLKIRYTQDDFENILVNQRQFLDETGNSLTPVSPKLLERQVPTNNPTIAKAGSTQPRYVSACFGSPNKPGERNYKVIIPYHPTETGHNEHIQEIVDYNSASQLLEPKSPLSAIYHGENR